MPWEFVPLLAASRFFFASLSFHSATAAARKCSICPFRVRVSSMAMAFSSSTNLRGKAMENPILSGERSWLRFDFTQQN